MVDVSSLIPEKVRVKEVEDKGEVLLVKIDADGEEYVFGVDWWEVLDIKEFKNILLHWKNKVIPRKRRVRAMKEDHRRQHVERIKSLEV